MQARQPTEGYANGSPGRPRNRGPQRFPMPWTLVLASLSLVASGALARPLEIRNLGDIADETGIF